MKWIPVLAVAIVFTALYTGCTRPDSERDGATGGSSGTMQRDTTQSPDTTKQPSETAPAPGTEPGTPGGSTSPGSSGSSGSTSGSRPSGN